MSRKVRFAAALIILLCITCGSLSAFPLSQPVGPSHEGISLLTAAVDWIASLFSWDSLHGKTSHHFRLKIAVQVDPDGIH